MDTDKLMTVSQFEESAMVWNPQQLDLIKQQIAKDCSDSELALFAQVCQRTGLDPFARQIYAIKRGGRMTIQVGIDGLRLIAARTGLYDGSQTYWCGTDGQWQDVWLSKDLPAAAKTIVYRRGCTHSFSSVALMAEFKQNQGLWGSLPTVLLGKCSESAALRKAFPENLSGIYEPAEIGDRFEAEASKEAAAHGLERKTVALPAVPAAGKISPAQRKRMWAIAQSSGWTEAAMRSYLSFEYQIESTADIKNSYYEDLCGTLSDAGIATAWVEKVTMDVVSADAE
jgi:phage recombination protein Bet